MNARRHQMIFYSAMAMMVSLFLSRIALSITLAFFVLLCVVHSGWRQQIRNFLSNPLLWSVTLLFLFPFVSGLWSDDSREWVNNCRVKLPLLLLPVAFAAPFSFTRQQWKLMVYVFLGLVTAGTFWSMAFYLQDSNAINEGYLRAQSLVTPLENDHVRFSWLAAFAVIPCGWLAWENRKRPLTAILFIAVITWLAIYLHVLAARTGLFCLYIILLSGALGLVMRPGNKWVSVAMVAIVLVSPVVAYLMLPTFRNKVKYFRYDAGYFSKAHYLPGGNDATRIISLRAGWEVMKRNPLTGTGAGDILPACSSWYDEAYPGMQSRDKIIPSSEWLLFGTAMGVPGLLVFSCVMIIPFFTRLKKNKGWWYLVNLLIGASFLLDIGLEVQFGVFIYLFVLLFTWKWFRFAELNN